MCFWSVILTIIFLAGHNQHCIHDQIQKLEEHTYMGNDSESFQFSKIRTHINPLPIGIHFELTESFRKYKFMNEIKNNMLVKIETDFQDMIKIKYPKRPLFLPRSCKDGKLILVQGKRVCYKGCTRSTKCRGSLVPRYMLKDCATKNNPNPSGDEGLRNKDIVLFVTTSSCKGTTLAYAAYCIQDDETDRPIAGIVNICTNNFDVSNMLGSINTLKHEIIHALGFSKSAFGYFRDVNGAPITPRDRFGLPRNEDKFVFSKKVAKWYTVKRRSIKLNYTKVIWAFRLPTVLAIAAKHFGCPDLKFFPIEDFGEEGQIMSSHFDELVGGTELMTPITILGTARLSKITLAFLEDTGWYIADYSRTDQYSYGKNLGCDFITKGCYSYMIANPTNIAPFCNTYRGYTDRCSADGLYVKRCHLTKYLTLNPKYQYFTNIVGGKAKDGSPQNFAGTMVYNEYCPVYGLVRRDDKSNLLCTDTKNNYLKSANDKFLANYFGEHSLCFGTTGNRYEVIGYLRWSGFYGAACFKYFCNRKTASIIVTSRGVLAAKCKYKGDVQNFNDGQVKGAIECLSYIETCTPEKNFNSYAYSKKSIASYLFINSYTIIIVSTMNLLQLAWTI